MASVVTYADRPRRVEFALTPKGPRKAVRLGRVSAKLADAWRAWRSEHEKHSAATVARRVVAARTLWRRALRGKLVAEIPFVGVCGGHQANEARKVFVPPATIDAALAEAPEAEWCVIIALARYGGLRCPIGHYALRWGDIDWSRGTIRVRCPKPAHHGQFEQPVIPSFPELRKRRLDLFAEAAEGTEYAIARRRLGAMNLRQQ
ncbi:MAG: hypothetical protein HRF50_11670 [Phycisphaerae bacterium]